MPPSKAAIKDIGEALEAESRDPDAEADARNEAAAATPGDATADPHSQD